MTFKRDSMIQYLLAAGQTLPSWANVMEKTTSTRPHILEMPEMNMTYFELLSAMWLHEEQNGKKGMPIGDAAALISSLSPSRASRFVSHAVDLGYLEQEEDYRDKRRKNVQLSPETRTRIDEAIQLSMSHFEKIFIDDGREPAQGNAA
jgi:DNA-binding MarR family transcriptional regulator